MSLKIKLFSSINIKDFEVAINEWLVSFEGECPGIIVHGIQVAQGKCFVGTLLYADQGPSGSFGRNKEIYH